MVWESAIAGRKKREIRKTFRSRMVVDEIVTKEEEKMQGGDEAKKYKSE